MDNVECLKTCCGALAILAKDEANKLLIARDGTRLILTVMEGHATRPDLQVRSSSAFLFFNLVAIIVLGFIRFTRQYFLLRSPRRKPIKLYLYYVPYGHCERRLRVRVRVRVRVSLI